ncbi:CPBP family glutamic-type intramembrane protease [Kribbella solani]|uniref:CPBP family glutamic-type intramembrane protease n=2 Tax=Kribbella solani TaxID=236067 RepID=UPI0029A24A81|nr:CPBP family glutamic-type intramembrane protease [Kribbella solani]MDX2972345.1 CPBP family glutamic-type intramembrane protease [Kribbella solani]
MLKQLTRAWGRAAYGAAAMGIALGCAGVMSEVVGNRYLPAAVCTLVAALLIRPFRRAEELGLTPRSGAGLRGSGLRNGPRGLGSRTGFSFRNGLRGFGFGVLVTGGCAAVVLGAGTLAGWISWGSFHPGDVLVFLITNAVVAILLEAFPEELTLRGHTWSALRSHHRGLIAALGTTLLFLLVPGFSTVVQLVLSRILGLDSPGLSLAPAGQDPVSYFILLTVFGLTLIAARQATGSLWTSIGTHLTFLTVNRLTVDGADRDSGWSAELASPDVLLLIPLYLLLAAIIYRRTAR